jgi:general secretion pathway protein H
MQRQKGLTLLELMVVLLIISFVTTGVSLALRDSSQSQLEREAQRLVAKLEAARAQSRTSGQTMVWRPDADGFVISTLPLQSNQPATKELWLQTNTQVTLEGAPSKGGEASAEVVLGPEPILSPIQIALRINLDQNNPTAPNTLRIGTDGLRPFEVLP